MRILVTGATGRVGSEIAQFIDRQANQVVLAMRTPESTGWDRTESVLFDFAQPSTYEPALNGVNSLFLMRPPAVKAVDRRLKQIVDVAIALNIQQIVFLSVLGAEQNKLLPHRATEDYIKSTGIAYTFLRASFFMQNLSSVHRREIEADSEIFVPAGQGKTSFVDARDIAAVAAAALTGSGHKCKAYSLTGREALNYYQVAEILSDVLARPIIYANPSVFQFIARQLERKAPLDLTLVMSGIYTTAKLGMAGRIFDDVVDVLGRSPISFRTFAEDYRDCWL
ncbi:MAG: NmrA family NAD(P)-binding protein [Phormidesmis sp.]